MIQTFRSDMANADEIKRQVGMKGAAEFYGFKPNQSGFICCPFHGEKTPSLKLYESSWYCFGCHKGGSVIDFVMNLFGLEFHDAIIKIGKDFGVETSEVTSADRLNGIARRFMTQKKKEREDRIIAERAEKTRRYHELQDYVKNYSGSWMSDDLTSAIQELQELERWWANDVGITD